MNTDEPSAADGRNQAIQVPECLAVSSAISVPLREILVYGPLFGPSPHVASKNSGLFISLAEAHRSPRKTHGSRAPDVCEPPNREALTANRRGARRFWTLAVQIRNKAVVGVHPWLKISFPASCSRRRKKIMWGKTSRCGLASFRLPKLALRGSPFVDIASAGAA
jgi:hypothetical protein